MKKKVSVILVLVFVLINTNCATVFKGTTQDVRFNSDPQRAEVWINGVKMGETPMNLKLESKKSYTIEFRKEGWTSEIRNITNHIGVGWIILDILGGLVPVIVDAATGAWYKLDQENIDAILRKQQPYTILTK